ncbi:glycosyltransferase family 4 protein [Mobilicoccus pelagius]|uniref:Putative glycosyltransferase n=1 Tax=Mobilicoccus pelagius NBRC 104925 TaxID=1089455 RepID=H5UMJ8_9MICO|nr:glycosyltransferase family 4 protein [Mobilicoccus pelagius]GAB46956.1 putative glycosyltransferase [Mobilicoccus pelagius NBRC 104925]
MGLRVAVLSYRSKPHVGGQGVYVRHLTRALVQAGHEVTVFSGQPYPELDPGVRLEKVPSLDLYREPDPFRMPRLNEYRDAIDVLEVAGMMTAAFPEPLTFSLRAARALRGRTGEFDVVHDNQCLGYGLLDIARHAPLVTTIHHPITRDRTTDLAGAAGWRRVSLSRWYSFLTMQKRVARTQRHVLTVSTSSARDIATDFGVDPARIDVVPLGVETDVFTPDAHDGPRVPGRLVTMASADVPLKGVDVLLHALARRREQHPCAPLELVLVSRPTPGGRTETLVRGLGLTDVVTVRGGLTDAELAALVASAQVACVPSRYEGFSLPTVEAMACGTPLVVSDAGAIGEVVGHDGTGGAPGALVVPPGDVDALAGALGRLLDDPDLRERLGRGGRDRALADYAWPTVAARTAEVYRRAIEDAAACSAGSPARRRHENGVEATEAARVPCSPATTARDALRDRIESVLMALPAPSPARRAACAALAVGALVLDSPISRRARRPPRRRSLPCSPLTSAASASAPATVGSTSAAAPAATPSRCTVAART